MEFPLFLAFFLFRDVSDVRCKSWGGGVLPAVEQQIGGQMWQAHSCASADTAFSIISHEKALFDQALPN